MDGTEAIEWNRDALRRLLCGLFAMAGLRGRSPFHPQDGARPQDAATAEEDRPSPVPTPAVESKFAATLPRRLHRAILRLLRPAESAARRLIIAAARTLVVILPPPRRAKSTGNSAFLRKPGGTGILLPPGMPVPGTRPRTKARSHAFPLLDPLRRPMRRRARSLCVPRINVPGFTTPFPVAMRVPPRPHDPIDAAPLALRLTALAAALDDLPGQARRFARRQAFRIAAATRAGRDARHGRRPLRLGYPPGRRPERQRRDGSEVDAVLAQAHSLALFALAHPDTS